MNVIQRLLIRDEIDALELDLARAHDRSPNEELEIRQKIARLERLIAQPALHRRSAPPAKPFTGAEGAGPRQ
ncbi:hypothetical protein [Candidatus Viadribacter manganicus]|uniref:hypothetical protein n=1 Tax=Candidatus Viadribacter manganicus TaxID=1759059 RepID=UPI0012E9D391|nr:hypothetical protein [Candidatus Viadribacter manganicus]